MLQGYLYESALERQLLLWFDRESKVMGVADTWPGQVSAKKGKGRRLKSKTCQRFGRDNLMKYLNHFFLEY